MPCLTVTTSIAIEHPRPHENLRILSFSNVEMQKNITEGLAMSKLFKKWEKSQMKVPLKNRKLKSIHITYIPVMMFVKKYTVGHSGP